MLERNLEKHLSRRERASGNAYLEAVSSIEGVRGSSYLLGAFWEMPFPQLLMALRLAVSRLDGLVVPVHHVLAPTARLKIDVEAMKHAARHLFEQGDRRPAVILEASGNYAVGHLPEEGKLLPPLEEVETAVYYLDVRLGFSIAFKMSWNDVVACFEAGI